MTSQLFEDGTKVAINDGFTVPFYPGVPSLYEIDVAGGMISGSLIDEDGNQFHLLFP